MVRVCGLSTWTPCLWQVHSNSGSRFFFFRSRLGRVGSAHGKFSSQDSASRSLGTDDNFFSRDLEACVKYRKHIPFLSQATVRTRSARACRMSWCHHWCDGTLLCDLVLIANLSLKSLEECLWAGLGDISRKDWRKGVKTSGRAYNTFSRFTPV